ncbi:MAG: hypothetical protein RL011_1907 [Pseudomonadota bacterium]|jgi:predicted phosphoribosyltransferase
MARFRNREDAGQGLAAKLATEHRIKGLKNPLVLGLPRGGIPVAYEIAKRLGAQLDVLVTRKLGVPGHEELAFGAIGPEGICILDEGLIKDCDITKSQIEVVVRRESLELTRRQALYRVGESGPISFSGRAVILVDDGIATGATMRAAAEASRKLGAQMIVVAIPVAPVDGAERLGKDVDIYICTYTPPFFASVGEWYDDFSQTSDEEVVRLLKLANSVKISPQTPASPA